MKMPNEREAQWLKKNPDYYWIPTRETFERIKKSNEVVRNRLTDYTFKPYPIKSIEPQGWLRRQLEIHAAGMGGQLDTFWPSLKESRWIGGHIPGEKDPVDNMIYWLDGIIPMAWQLNDESLKAKCHKYVNEILSRQWENGWLTPDEPEVPFRFGKDGKEIREEDTWEVSGFSEGWAQAGISKVLIEYYEATEDPRVPAAIEKSLRFLDTYLDKLTIRSWGSIRWVELLIPIYWLYERTHEEWLIHMARRLKCMGFDWIEFYSNEDLWQYKEPMEQGHWVNVNHVVNNAMAVKTGGMVYRMTHRESDREGSKQMLDLINKYHGLVTGMYTGDENFGGQLPIHGSELCAVVELMFSLELLTAITGEIEYADRLEKLAYNCLPATFDPKMTVHQYSHQVNQVQCSHNDERVYMTNGPEANMFGVEPHFPCCTTQTQGWPKYAQSLFMQAKDGIAVISYSPAKLSTKVYNEDVMVTIGGNYPFEDKVEITVTSAKEQPFVLYLRIPGWAKNATVKIEGETIKGEAGTYLKLERMWKKETEIELLLPAEYEFVPRPNRLAALTHGPLVYAHPIAEKWEQESKSEGKEKPWLNNWSVFPTEDWNYGYLEGTSISVSGKPIGDYPFSPDGAPVEIKVKAKKVAWKMEKGACTAAPSYEWIGEKVEDIRLIPFGCTNLRITEMPLLK
ncbi:hypothetical protein FACS189491_08060 [Spirochaetia bacterium]|nr:hypothetical protein FACS189491_08060 [Spirochaetia bacterium]